MNKLQQIGTLASKSLQEAMKSGLTWDEAVAAFGIAAKALADQAAKEGDGKPEDCHAHAKKRFEEGFVQPTHLVFARSDLSAFASYSQEDAAAILENCNVHIITRVPALSSLDDLQRQEELLIARRDSIARKLKGGSTAVSVEDLERHNHELTAIQQQIGEIANPGLVARH